MRTSAILRGAGLCLLLMATVWNSRSQSPYQPKITLTSPEAASLGQYGNVDVNLYTGQPGIEVPLLSAKLATGFVLPLKISYGANGLRPHGFPPDSIILLLCNPMAASWLGATTHMANSATVRS